MSEKTKQKNLENSPTKKFWVGIQLENGLQKKEAPKTLTPASPRTRDNNKAVALPFRGINIVTS